MSIVLVAGVTKVTLDLPALDFALDLKGNFGEKFSENMTVIHLFKVK